MRRRDFIAGLSVAAVAWPLAVRAQQPERMRRIGIILAITADDADYQALGRRVSAGAGAIGLDHRPQRADRHPLGRSQCRRNSQTRSGIGRACAGRYSGHWRLDPGADAAGDRTVPIVFPFASDPVGAGFVDSLARPGGNATGFVSFEFSLSAKWLELLKQTAPGVTRAAVLRDATQGSGTSQFAVIQAAAPSLGVEVKPVNMPRRRGDRARRHGLCALSRRWPDRDGEPGRARVIAI